MHKEAGERRDFLAGFGDFVARVGADAIVVEDGYGAGMGIVASDYAGVPGLRFGTVDECFAEDVVVVLRCPTEQRIRRMRRGAALVSMLHFPTRPGRLALFNELGVVTARCAAGRGRRRGARFDG